MPNDLLVTTTDILGIEVAKEYSGASGIYVDNENNVISITGDVGKEYNGIEPIVVNNEENLISANSAPIGVQEPLYFVQDDDEAVIIGLSGEYVTPSDIAGKLDSSAFESWQQGQYTNDLTAINEKINEVSSNFEGYATEQWVEDKGYLTAVSIPESASWNETSEVVESNSSTWNTVSDKLDVTAQVISSCETSSVNDKTLVTKLNGNEIAVSYAGSAHVADIALKDYQGNSFVPFYAKTSALEEKLDTNTFAEASGNFQPVGDYAERDFVLSSIESDTSGKLDVSSFASVSGDFLTTSFGISESATWNETSDVVQSNSAQWAEGGGAISSYTSAWSYDVPPYGDYVINSLNGKYLSAYVSLSADNAKVAKNANSSTYAQTVDENKLENDGFVKNLTSEYGTISVVRNTIESTNSAISRVGNEGFVSSFQDNTIGPYLTANFSWDKSLPNTTFNFKTDYAPNNTTVTYSANTNLTGEVTVTSVGRIPFSVSVPNATELNVWANDWVQIMNNVASAADTFETVVGELAWASALPTYEYDGSNKISAINGSAIAAGDEFPSSANEAITAYQNASATYLTAHQAISAEEWNSNYETVTTNSGAWGGSALPISAGPGIKVNLVDNTLVFSNDETVLWENNGTLYAVGQTISFNESPSAFEKLEFKCGVDVQSPECLQFEYHPGNLVLSWHELFNSQFRQWYTLLNVQNDGATAVSGQVYFADLGSNSTFTAYNQGPNWEYNFRGIQKIVGINRK